MTLTRAEHRHPRTLLPLRVHLTGRRVVLLVDANVVMRDLHTALRFPERPSPALFELLDAPHAHIVMSKTDLRENAQGVPRIEANIRRKFPEHAPGMLQLWAERVRPRLVVLDPAGVPDTPLSAEVRGSARDPDDADLALLAHVLNADGLFSYDRKAFGGLFNTLRSQGEHGALLCAFRDDLRVDEAIALMFGAPVTALATGVVEGSKALHRRGVPYGTQAALLAAATGALLLWRPAQAFPGRAASLYAASLMHLEPGAELRQQLREAQNHVRKDWGPSQDPVVRVARHLIRQPAPLTCSSLIDALNLRLSARELSGQLRAHPGLFQPYSGRRWGIRSSLGEAPA